MFGFDIVHTSLPGLVVNFFLLNQENVRFKITRSVVRPPSCVSKASEWCNCVWALLLLTGEEEQSYYSYGYPGRRGYQKPEADTLAQRRELHQLAHC